MWLGAGFSALRPGFTPVLVQVGSVVEKFAQGQFFSKFFGPITMFICHRPMRCALALTTRTLSYRRPYVRGFISGPALGWNGGKKALFFIIYVSLF
jgi:hypothetical protein